MVPPCGESSLYSWDWLQELETFHCHPTNTFQSLLHIQPASAKCQGYVSSLWSFRAHKQVWNHTHTQWKVRRCHYIGWLSLKLGMKQKRQSLFGSYWVWGSLSPWLLGITRSGPDGLGPCFPPHYLWLVIIQWVLSLLWLKITIFLKYKWEKVRSLSIKPTSLRDTV